MAAVHEKPYGSWKSPITTDVIVAETIGIFGLQIEGDAIYWNESHPQEGGRVTVIQRNSAGQTTELVPGPYYVRTRVHEYGGGAYLVSRGRLFFSNFADQRLYRIDQGRVPYPITPEAELRYADYISDDRRGLLYSVREDHRLEGEAVNTLVKIMSDGDEHGGEVIVAGNNFYSSPRLSPDGTQLAWLTWNHPNMPWDGTELWIGELTDDGSIHSSQKITGGKDVSIFQPEWSPDGRLYFISDQTGWWNLYRYEPGEIQALHPMNAEFGQPQWGFRQTTYAFESANRLVCTYDSHGISHLASLDCNTLEFTELIIPFTSVSGISALPGSVIFFAGSPTEKYGLYRMDLATRDIQLIRSSRKSKLDTGYISIAQPIEFPTAGGLTAFGLYYPPRNQDFRAPENEKPPLLVMSHGGPTGATDSALSETIQFWTSRGIAVLDVNYGGSTGYGRAYRQRLNGQWGVVDVDDCVNGARYLVERGSVDGQRLMIRGGSAGGYTTLCALTFRDVFKAGASHFGIGDLLTFVYDTHKFESRYLDSLVGPYPERQDLYRQRSAIYYTDRLSCPIILFQGADDKVVPPSQSRTMYEAVKAKGLPVAYLEFPGEQHGFRKSENIKRALDAELYFYSQVFHFELADPVEPVTIDNLS